MTRLLVLRPEPGASATVAAARALGLEAIAAPLFAIRPLVWTLPETTPEAVLMTSANAVRYSGAMLAALAHLPLYAVGGATAEAARAAGFAHVVTGDSDATAILARAHADGVRHLLHLAGREHRAIEVAGLPIERRLVYAAEPVATLPAPARDALPDAIALLHSPRAARLFTTLIDPAGVAIATISPAALEAAGRGWRATAVAQRPTDAALLAAAAGLCDQGSRGRG